MKNCPACNSQNPDEASFCLRCGSPLNHPSTQFAQPQPQYPQSYPPQQYLNVKPLKDKSLAMILEILPGLFGFLGFGWIYAGNTSTGLIWLFGFLAWTVIATIISVATAGIGIFCWFPISVAGIVFSAVALNRYTKQHPEIFG
jgi:hypothetical protein